VQGEHVPLAVEPSSPDRRELVTEPFQDPSLSIQKEKIELVSDVQRVVDKADVCQHEIARFVLAVSLAFCRSLLSHHGPNPCT
jgi:hypothetical protein